MCQRMIGRLALQRQAGLRKMLVKRFGGNGSQAKELRGKAWAQYLKNRRKP